VELSSRILQARLPPALSRRESLSQREEFDFVIIDTPPINRCADAIALGQFADGFVLFVEADITRRYETTVVDAFLHASKIPIMAAVFNEDTPTVQEKVTTAPSRICGSLYSSWLHYCQAKHLKARVKGTPRRSSK